MYISQAGQGAGPAVLGQTQLFQPSPSGNQCFHGWFREGGRPGTRYQPTDRVLLDHQTMNQDTYRLIGFMEGLEVQHVIGTQYRTGPTGQFMAGVVIKGGWVSTPIPGGHRADWVPDPSAQTLAEFMAWNNRQRARGPYTICGPVFTDPQGTPYVVVSAWEQGPWLHNVPPEEVTISGTLGTCSPPGISQIWPCVDGTIVTTGRWDSAEANRFVRMWNANELLVGAELRVKGYPTEARGLPAIVPTSFTVLKAGTTPVDDPGKIDFPDRPDSVDREPPGFDPQEDDPEDFDPLSPWDGIDPITGEPPPDDTPPPNGNGGDLPALPPGNGTAPPPDGNGAPPDGNGAPRAAGLSMPVVVTGLLLLPLLFGKDRKG